MALCLDCCVHPEKLCDLHRAAREAFLALAQKRRRGKP